MHLRSVIVGEKFHPGASEHLRQTNVGDTVELIHEPSNPYDPHAVRCHVGGKMCGYIPRAHNERIAKHLMGGGKVHATFADRGRVEIDLIETPKGDA